MQFSYRKEVPDVETRRNECRKVLEKNPEKIPIIFEKDPKSQIEPFPKTRYLVSKDLTVNHFQLLLRNKLKLNETQAFFLLVQGKYTILGENTLAEIYQKFKDKDDGFLYMMYSTEQVWG
jgi:hypothetical protein